jgi:hypothetical protein
MGDDPYVSVALNGGRISEAVLMRFLQEVGLPQTCLLNQTLLWVAFQRSTKPGLIMKYSRARVTTAMHCIYWWAQ